MSERTDYPHGVPNWVTCLTTDLVAARRFYGAVFGWTFNVSDEHRYAVALLNGREVAGIGLVPPDTAPGWTMQVCVDDASATAQAAVANGGRLLDGPLDMSPASILAVLADPAGAVVCAAQTVGRFGAELVNEPGAWSMGTLHTAAPQAVTPFYTALFGWGTRDFGPATLYTLPGYVGGEPSQPVPRDVIAVAVPDPGPPHWAVDFWVTDADAATAAALAHGGAVLSPPTDQQHVPFRQAVLADPDGSAFTVSQLLPAG